MVFKVFIKDVKEEWSSYIKVGFDAVKEFEFILFDFVEDICV